MQTCTRPTHACAGPQACTPGHQPSPRETRGTCDGLVRPVILLSLTLGYFEQEIKVITITLPGRHTS